MTLTLFIKTDYDMLAAAEAVADGIASIESSNHFFECGLAGLSISNTRMTTDRVGDDTAINNKDEEK